MTQLPERFWEKVDRSDPNGCWLWTGRHTGRGYCHFSHDLIRKYVHRWAYEAFVGPIPAGLVIDHLCSIRNCVNPDHLEAVTAAENVRRAPSANAAKTKCPRGHAYDRINKQGKRMCMTCRRHQDRRYYAARRLRESLCVGPEA